jgi:hypothetical protein
MEWNTVYQLMEISKTVWRSQWPRGLRRRCAAARLLRSWVPIPPEAWMFVCCECCVLSGRGLCDGLITRPEESYRLWCVVVCDLENLKNEEAMTRVGSQRHSNKKIFVRWLVTMLIMPVVKIHVFWLLTLCRWAKRRQRFEECFCLYLH